MVAVIGDVSNSASIALHERLGFRTVGVFAGWGASTVAGWNRPDAAGLGPRRGVPSLNRQSGSPTSGRNKTNGRAIFQPMSVMTATTKGAATREAIIDRAYGIACSAGLEGLSIGPLAQAVGHVQERRLRPLRFARGPATGRAGRRRRSGSSPRAATRRSRLPADFPGCAPSLEGWFEWARQSEGGCVLLSAASEYDDRPGPLRDRIVQNELLWREQICRAVQIAVDVGDLAADTEPEQMAFELYSLALTVHHDAGLFGFELAVSRGRRAFERLFRSYTPQSTPLNPDPHPLTRGGMPCTRSSPKLARSFVISSSCTALRLGFLLGSRVAPDTTLQRAARLFTTPLAVVARARVGGVHLRRARERRSQVDGHAIATYVWGDPRSQPYVLFAHGWSSHGTRIAPWLPRLLRRWLCGGRVRPGRPRPQPRHARRRCPTSPAICWRWASTSAPPPQ